MMDLAEAIAPGCEVKIVGIRPGEKLHEVMVSEDDSRNSLELDDCYAILPAFPWWDSTKIEGKSLPEGFKFASDTNTKWLTIDELKIMAEN